MMHYSVSGMDECVPCNLPLALVDNRCVWWHLPLLALGLGALGVCGGLVFFWNRSRKAKKIEQKIERILEEVYTQLWDAWPDQWDPQSARAYSFLMFSGYLRPYGCFPLSSLSKIYSKKLMAE